MNKWLVIIATTLVSFTLAAQNRPTIGLALSGGGAKSMAHIGVLRELEKHNIRPDYITGTSMGAIIGAMYAQGMSPDQIEHLLAQVDWEALLNNSIPRYQRSYLDRKSEDRYTVSFAIDSTGIGLPDALNSGQYVLATLATLFQEVHCDTVFSEFDIPFACVATDLETGEMVIFEDGDLADVLRATSAFPSIFSPHEIDGRIYIDGGVTNNLPIELLHQKGMQYIIASNAQANLATRENLDNIVSVLEQVGSFPNMVYYEEQKQYANLIIQPPLDPFNIVSYEYSDSIIHLGEIETAKYSATLRKIAPSTPLRPRLSPTPKERIFIRSISMDGNSSTTERYVKSTLDLNENDTNDTKDIYDGIQRLYGSNFYDQVDYRLTPVGDGAYDLKVRLIENKNNHQLRLGIHYDDDFNVGVLLNLTARNVLLKNSKFSVDAVISDNPRAEMSYIFERGFIPALGFRADFHQFDSRIYQEGNPISEYTYTDFSSEIFVHSTLWDLYTLGGGVRLENIDISEPILRDEVSEMNTTYLNYFAYIDFDSFNKSYKPTNGFSLAGEFKLISEQVDYRTYLEPVSVAHVTYHQAFKLGNRVGGSARVMAAATIGPDAPFPYSIFLGSLGENYTQHIFPFIGYRYMELFGRNAAVLRGDIWYEAFDNHYFTLHANIGKLEATVSDLYSSDVLLDGYGISYGYNSPIGPLELFLTKSTNHSELYTYVRLGFWF